MAGARFEGTDTYVATGDLMLTVNAAITLERPLLIKGEPGTGKTMLAEDIPSEALRDQDARQAIPPLYGALLKHEQDVHLFERLAFLHRRNAR